MFKIEPMTEEEMTFFRELFSSKLPVTIDNVEIVASVKKKVLSAKFEKPKESDDSEKSGKHGPK